MSSLTNPKIFIAEDDDAILELLKIRLEDAGYETFHATDGLTAVSEIYKIAPDAVILDIGLPKLDGFGVLEQIRSTPRYWKTPVLMLTARHAAADVKRAIDAGAQDYLAKPFEVGELLVRLTRHLRGRARPANTP
jgi:two-component system OmpR family response regulator